MRRFSLIVIAVLAGIVSLGCATPADIAGRATPRPTIVFDNGAFGTVFKVCDLNDAVYVASDGYTPHAVFVVKDGCAK